MPTGARSLHALQFRDMIELLGHMSGQQKEAHPAAPLTKRSSVPMGASLLSPSTMARQSLENSTCSHYYWQ